MGNSSRGGSVEHNYSPLGDFFNISEERRLALKTELNFNPQASPLGQEILHYSSAFDWEDPFLDIKPSKKAKIQVNFHGTLFGSGESCPI